MTFQARVRCDAFGCTETAELECFDPANAEDAIFALNDWFIDSLACDHYCPKHAKAAREEWQAEQPERVGIYPTSVG